MRVPGRWYGLDNPGLADIGERYPGARRDARIHIDKLPVPDYVDPSATLVNLPALFAVARVGLFDEISIAGGSDVALTATTGGRFLRRISDTITGETLPFLGGTISFGPKYLAKGYDLTVLVNTGLIDRYADGDSSRWIAGLDASVRTVLEGHSPELVTINRGKMKPLESLMERRGFGRIVLENVMFLPEKTT